MGLSKLLKMSKIFVVIAVAFVPGLLGIGALGQEERVPAPTVSEEQILAGLAVLQD